MKNIILQHWAGPQNDLVSLSISNISQYAKSIGVEYQLLEGMVFNPKLSCQCQKLYMLDEVWDEYDMVVMLDADMFIRKGMNKNVFEDVVGVGRHTSFQTGRFNALCRNFPKLTNSAYPFWGGAIYRLNREIRQEFRKHIRENEMVPFSNSAFHDEGIMHRLATLANFKCEQPYIQGPYWDHGSYESDIDQANIIHVRTKQTPTGPRRDKILNYKELVNKGII